MKKMTRSDLNVSSKKFTAEEEEELLQKQMRENQIKNFKIGNSEVRLIGDKIILVQVIKRLADIRHAIQNGMKTSIDVKIGQRIANAEFTFDVNQLPIDDLITQDEIVVS